MPLSVLFETIQLCDVVSQNAVYRMVNELELVSTDQQTIYIMINMFNVSTKIQVYKSDGRFNKWFHLGYLTRDIGLNMALGI